jgi:glycosyltransferase involved in cell wall biosynthesis
MRIAFVADQLDNGGAEQQLVTLCHGLKARGHDVGVISVYNRLALRSELDSVQVPIAVAAKHGKFDLTAVWRIRTRIARLAPDLVHAYLPAASFLTPLTTWIGVRAPVLQSERGINDWRSALRLRCDNIVRRSVTHITCNADAIKQHLIAVEGVAADKISVIYNGLRDQRRQRPTADAIAAAQRSIRAPADAVTVVCVANFSAVKQHHVLVDAFARARTRMPNLFLLLVGQGELEADVRRQIGQARLQDSVRIITDCTNPAPLLCASHIAILTSQLEGCSNAILEAMAMGLPVVASDTGGNPELVENGEGGYICEVGNRSAFADAMLKLASAHDVASAMGDFNRRRIRDQFTDDVMIARTLSLYERILRG